MQEKMKYALYGFVAGAAIMVAVGASNNPSGPGRFQITAAANYMAVLDTVTGQVWAGNFNQLGPAAGAMEFRTCPQGSGDFFKVKAD